MSTYKQEAGTHYCYTTGYEREIERGVCVGIVLALFNDKVGNPQNNEIQNIPLVVYYNPLPDECDHL